MNKRTVFHLSRIFIALAHLPTFAILSSQIMISGKIMPIGILTLLFSPIFIEIWLNFIFIPLAFLFSILAFIGTDKQGWKLTKQQIIVQCILLASLLFPMYVAAIFLFFD